MTEPTARHDGLMPPTSDSCPFSTSSSSLSWLLLLLLVGLAGPCAALLHMIKIYLDQIEKNETSGNNKLVQQRVIRGVGEGECSGGSLWFSCVYCGMRRAGNAEAAIDGPLSRVAHTHTHTHARTHTHLCHVCVCVALVVHVRLLDASTSPCALWSCCCAIKCVYQMLPFSILSHSF